MWKGHLILEKVRKFPLKIIFGEVKSADKRLPHYLKLRNGEEEEKVEEELGHTRTEAPAYIKSPEEEKHLSVDAGTWRKTTFMNEFLNSTEERTEGIVTMSLISAKYQVFRVFVIVTLMLDVCGTQGLQAGIFLCQVLHCCLHVQPDKEANKQIQHRNLKKHFITWLPCCYVW